ncbi:universal stress protein, partial [Nocardioides luteus]
TKSSPRDIVVGVQDAATSSALVRRGLEVAAERGAPLRLVHAWRAYGAYDDPLGVGDEEERWTARAERELAEALAAARAGAGPETADVEVRLDAIYAQTAYALVEASHQAELLILGRGRHFFGFGHLGGTSRAVLRESRCPVEIDPHVAPAFEGDAGAPDGLAAAGTEPAGAGRG